MDMKAELIAHFFLTMPPYRTVSPGMLCRPTKVAAASCQALSPVSSHCGDGTSAMVIPRFQFVDGVSKAPTGVEADDSASFEERSKKSQQELCRAAQGGEVESMIN